MIVDKGDVRVLGLDPGLNRTGWGVVSMKRRCISHIAHGVIAPSSTLPLHARLLAIYDGVAQVIAGHNPDEAAIEETFHNTNPASTLKLGHARAAAMIAAAGAGLHVAEYAAKIVKKAVVGTGAADKPQVCFMIRRLLPTAEVTCPDSADALAVALTHLNFRNVRMHGAD